MLADYFLEHHSVVHVFINEESSLQLKAVKPPLQMRLTFDALRLILFLEGLRYLSCESFIKHIILEVFCQAGAYKATSYFIHLVSILFRSLLWLFFRS